MAVAVILLFTTEAASRIAREVKVTKTAEVSENAYYAAEAGFNRARARLNKTGDDQVLGLDGVTESLIDDQGIVVGQYTLQVTKPANLQYKIVSTGTASTGSTASATRIVSGTVTVFAKSGLLYPVRTAYDP